MKNQMKEEHLAAYRHTQSLFKAEVASNPSYKIGQQSFQPFESLHETSKEIDFQLMPPGLHCLNATKRAICTFKNHFIAGLCTTDPNFPLFYHNPSSC
jgi:hypothetical protein